MSILKIKDSQGDWVEVQSIKGKKGDPFTYADFTTEQLESLKGKDGISPTVSVASDTSDDYRLSFTDETHTVTTPNLIPEAEKIFSVYPHDTASGAVASFPDGADNVPLKSCIVQIEPVQEGSGDPSPDNVRPISGWTGCVISHSGADTSNPTTYPITFPTEAGTVYGGYIDPINGELVTCPYYASYNGETLTGEWISDRDKYVVGTTPTIGAQVVNIGAVGDTYPLTAIDIKTLLGQNNVWADTGDVSVEYRADTTLYISKKISEALASLT